MSFAFVVMTMLLGSSMVIAFVLQSSKEQPAAPANSPVSHHRCQGESIRKSLLRALNLQIEPRLPNAALDHVGEQWRTTFSSVAQGERDAAAPAVSDCGNSTSMRCCSMASEVSMKELGWDSWVILPVSVTIVRCALCSPEGHAVQCPSPLSGVQDSQAPCCQPTSEERVHVMYVDESGTVVLSSMQLTSSCGCGRPDLLQPSTE